MISLLRYECEKLIKRKVFRIIFLLCILSNLFFLWYFQQETTSSIPYDAYQKLDSELVKLPNKERIQFIEKRLERTNAFLMIEEIQKAKVGTQNLSDEDKKLYQTYSKEYRKNVTPLYTSSFYQDQTFLKAVLEDANYVQEYPTFLNQVKESADNLNQVSVFHKNQDSLTTRNIKKTANDYKNMNTIKPSIVISQGFLKVTQTGLTDVICIIFVFLMSILLIFEEKEKGLLALLRVNARGRLHTGVVKILISLIFSAIFLLILYGSQFIFQWFLTSFPDLGLPLQSIPLFRNSTWKFTIGEYLLVFLMTKWIALSLISLFMIAITIYTRHLFVACIGCFSILFLSFMLYTYIPSISTFHMWKYLNLIGFLNTNIFYQLYDNILIFDHIVSLQSIIFTSLACFTIFFLIFDALSFSYYRKISEQSTPRILRLPRRWIGKYGCCSLFMHEVYKTLVVQKGIFIIIIFFFLFGSYTSRETLTVQGDSMYQQYLKKMEGPLTKEKEVFMKQEKTQFEETNKKLDEIDKRYQKKELSLNQKIMAEEPYMLLLEKEKVFESIFLQYEYVKQHPNTWFVDQRGYLKILDTMNNEFPLFFTFTLLMVLLFSNMFAFEYQHQLIRFTSTCANGRKKIAKIKIRLALIFAILSFIILYLIYMLPILKIYNFSYGNAPIASLMAWKDIPFSISIYWFFILTFLCKLFAIITITFLVLYISQITKSIQSAFTLNIVLLLIPIILHFMGFDFFSILSFEPIFFSGSYYMTGDHIFLSLSYSIASIIISVLIYRYLIHHYGRSSLQAKKLPLCVRKLLGDKAISAGT